MTSSSTDTSDTPSGDRTGSGGNPEKEAPENGGSTPAPDASGDRPAEADKAGDVPSPDAAAEGAPVDRTGDTDAGDTTSGETTAGETTAGETTAGDTETTVGETTAGETSAGETSDREQRQGDAQPQAGDTGAPTAPPGPQPAQPSGSYDGAAPTSELPVIDEPAPAGDTPETSTASDSAAETPGGSSGTPEAPTAPAPPEAPTALPETPPAPPEAPSDAPSGAPPNGAPVTEPVEGVPAAATPAPPDVPPPPPPPPQPDRPNAYRFQPDRPTPYLDGPTPARHLRERRPQGDQSPPETDGESGDGRVAVLWASLLQRFQGRTALLIASLALPALLAIIVVAWAVDYATSSGEVHRNVRVAGQSIGGISEDALPAVLAEIGADVAGRDVVIEVEGETHEVEASNLGLTLNEQVVTDDALDAGRSGALVSRPFRWAWSFVSPHDVPLEFQVSETDTAAVLQLLLGEDRVAPVDPRVELFEGAFVVIPGEPGTDLDSAQVAADVLEAAQESPDPGSTITVSAPATDVEPRFSDDVAQRLADRANELTRDGLTVQADGSEEVLSTEQLRSWMTVEVTDEGDMELMFNTEAATQGVNEAFSHLTAEPQDATVVLEGGQPVVQPGENGVVCCGEDSGERVWEALEADDDTLELEVEVVEPEYTTEEVEDWGIEEPIGGARAWQSGSGDVSGPGPGFTTYYTAGQNRAHNIQRMADQVSGAVIPPGGRFSINERVGPRTAEGGYLADGAIRDREMVQEIGGGVSQFSTTMFNAAFFAGLDIIQYQPHSQYFDRYPPGREATMGHPAPDLVIENNTPYGMLVQATHTPTSVTVTFWSSPYARAEQSGINESQQGNCRIVTTTRTRTYPDGSSETDSFRAAYAPQEGQFC